MRHYVTLMAGFILHVSLLQGSLVGAAEAPMPKFSSPGQGRGAPPTSTQPPWRETQERRPKEVKDKESETPLTSCKNSNALTGEKIFVTNYVDSGTGATTTIRRVDIPEQPRIGSPTPAKTVWEIMIQQPGEPKKKITYHLESGNETRTEKTGNDKPTTRKVAGDDMYSPEVKKGSLPFGNAGRALARITQREAEPLQLDRGTNLESFAAVLMPQPTWPASGAAGRPEGASIIMKSDAWGAPPQVTFAIMDVSPPMTADEYVLSQALDTLEAEWQADWGPGDFRPGDKFTTEDGQHIEIVGDWSLARVPGGFLMTCGGFDLDDEEEYYWRTRYGIEFDGPPIVK